MPVIRKYIFDIYYRQALIDTNFLSVICAPVYSSYNNLSTQVELDIADGMKKHCSVHCDELISLPELKLTAYLSTLSQTKLEKLNAALAIAVGID